MIDRYRSGYGRQFLSLVKCNVYVCMYIHVTKHWSARREVQPSTSNTARRYKYYIYPHLTWKFTVKELSIHNVHYWTRTSDNMYRSPERYHPAIRSSKGILSILLHTANSSFSICIVLKYPPTTLNDR